MKTSNKLLLGLFFLILISLIVINVKLKMAIGNIPIQKELLKSHSQIIGNSLFIDFTEVILSMDKNTTIVDISNYKTKLKEVNIDLIIEKIEYDSDNKIKSLAITVDCNDGSQGWTRQDLSGNEKIGFYRIYGKTDKQPFAMTPLEFTVQRSADSTETYVSINENMAKTVKFKTGLNEQKDKVVLTIDENTTQAELENYFTKLKARNIDFMVKRIEIEDQTKKIKSIEILVDCNDGFKGTIKQTLDKYKTVGFYRNYNKNAQSPFGLLPSEAQQADIHILNNN